ncbi:MAG TPA: nucleotidyltransferase domain-containing protein [Thermoanaerobaculia bacterium]
MVDPDVESLLSTVLSALAERHGLAAAYLFGSVARGEGRAGSDLDVGVLYSSEPPATLDGLGFDLQGDLEAAVGRAVDLVVLNRAPIDLVMRVLRDGVILLDRDRSRRIRFEVRSRNEYWDLEPYLRLYRRQGATGA